MTAKNIKDFLWFRKNLRILSLEKYVAMGLLGFLSFLKGRYTLFKTLVATWSFCFEYSLEKGKVCNVLVCDN